jgi:MFS family permease
MFCANRHDMKRTSTLRRWTGVFILFSAYGIAFVDRQILSLLVAPIRADLCITDTEFSLLIGFAFALFYALFGIPIGRWADKGDRSIILATGIALWSGFTCLCGLSHNFLQLFLSRMGVGAGEATVVPVTYSLLADYFPPERRGLALGLFGSGVYFGLGGGMIAGGMLVASFESVGTIELPVLGVLHTWQTALLLLGAPGVALSLCALLLSEPRRQSRRASHDGAPGGAIAATNGAAWKYYRRAGLGISLHHLTVAFMAMVLYAVLAWAPEHFRRTFGMTPAHTGARMGAVILAAGTLGVLAGGIISDHLVRLKVKAARMLILLIASLLALPASFLLAFGPNSTAALIGLGGTIFCISTLTSVGAAGVQELLPTTMRGLGAAVFQLVVNLLALSLGPALVAVVTEYVFKDEQRLGSALGVTLPLMLLFAAGLAGFGIKSYANAVECARSLSTAKPASDALGEMRW